MFCFNAKPKLQSSGDVFKITKLIKNHFSLERFWLNRLIVRIFFFFLENWCQHWFEYFPNPPLNILSMVENVVAHHDKELLQHLVDCGITSQVRSVQTHKDSGCCKLCWNYFLSLSQLYVWPLLETLFSEVLTRDEWLRLFDNIFSNHPSFLLMACAAYIICCREPLLHCSQRQDFEVQLVGMWASSLLPSLWNLPSHFFSPSSISFTIVTTWMLEPWSRRLTGLWAAPQLTSIPGLCSLTLHHLPAASTLCSTSTQNSLWNTNPGSEREYGCRRWSICARGELLEESEGEMKWIWTHLTAQKNKSTNYVCIFRQQMSALRADFVRRRAEEEAFYAQQVNSFFFSHFTVMLQFL